MSNDLDTRERSELRQVLAAMESLAPSAPDLDVVRVSSAPVERRRRPLVWLAVAVVATVIAIGVPILLFGGDDDVTSPSSVTSPDSIPSSSSAAPDESAQEQGDLGVWPGTTLDPSPPDGWHVRVWLAEDIPTDPLVEALAEVDGVVAVEHLTTAEMQARGMVSLVDGVNAIIERAMAGQHDSVPAWLPADGSGLNEVSNGVIVVRLGPDGVDPADLDRAVRAGLGATGRTWSGGTATGGAADNVAFRYATALQEGRPSTELSDLIVDMFVEYAPFVTFDGWLARVGKDADVVSVDPLVIQPRPGPAPDFDTSPLGTYVALDGAGDSDPTEGVRTWRDWVATVDGYLGDGSVEDLTALYDPTRPLVHIGQIDHAVPPRPTREEGAPPVVRPAPDPFLGRLIVQAPANGGLCVIHEGDGCFDFDHVFSDVGPAMELAKDRTFFSAFSNEGSVMLYGGRYRARLGPDTVHAWDVPAGTVLGLGNMAVVVRVPLETSVVAVSIGDSDEPSVEGALMWQRPVAGLAAFPTYALDPHVLTVTAYDSNGGVIYDSNAEVIYDSNSEVTDSD